MDMLCCYVAALYSIVSYNKTPSQPHAPLYMYIGEPLWVCLWPGGGVIHTAFSAIIKHT